MEEVRRREFRCDLCGEVACTIELVPAHVEHTDSLARKPGQATLLHSGFLGDHAQLLEGAERVRSLELALHDPDARTLYRLGALLAPFYCPACERVYCIRHWTTRVRYDEDFPSHYDQTDGLCPQGHSRMIDD